MNEPYTFEPSRAEILQTTLLSGTLGRLFYRPFVRALTIRPEDRVLDYCAGSGILTDLIARRYRPREVVFTDVSLSWLQTAQARMKKLEARVCDNDHRRLSRRRPYDTAIVQ
jgi:ubiquinone/menaquinone biosynthesis C-methylase UbiE